MTNPQTPFVIEAHSDEPAVVSQDAAATRLLHPLVEIPPGFQAFPVPTVRASTVIFSSLENMRQLDWREEGQWRYGLHATPTSMELAQRLAQIEGGKHCVLLPSGLAAISLVYFALLKSGDEVLVPDNVYGPNREHAQWLERDFGIRMRVYDPMIGEKIQACLSPETKLIWLEAPGSITMEIPDVPAITRVARERGVCTVLDNTWSAGLYFRPFSHDVDISIQALTKYQSGGSDVLMGAVTCVDSNLYRRLKQARMRMGWNVSADDCYFLLRGLASLSVRLEAHQQSAWKIAQWLKTRPEVLRVLHPAFADCPGHHYWQRDFIGASGLFSVVFRNSYCAAQIDAFIEQLRLFKIGFSWGGAHSLILPYDVSALRRGGVWPPEDWADKKNAGVLVRIYIGLEDVQDLMADLQRGLSSLVA